jgi:predicted transcriptional regulator
MLEDSNDIGRMNKKQKEALVLALAEKGKTYREITREAGVSPNTIKAVLSKSGLDESTSIHSRAFELFSEGRKNPLQVAITLNLEADQAIQYHQQYYMLLGCTEFTKVYLQVKDNPWPYVNLVNLVKKSGMGDGEVVELLKIANGYLPRVRLEYDRVKEEINLSKAELNSWKAATSNEVRLYQDFCDRNLALKNREDELQSSINDLEIKETELQKTTTELQLHLAKLQENDAYNDNLNLEIKQEEVIFSNDVFIRPSNMVIDYNHPNEEGTLHHPSKVGPSSGTLIFDTKDLF